MPATRADYDKALRDAIRAQIGAYYGEIVTTPPGAARKPIYRAIRDLKKLLKWAESRTE